MIKINEEIYILRKIENMALTLAEKILQAHIVSEACKNTEFVKGTPIKRGSDIAIKIDQTLTQDATGTMANTLVLAFAGASLNMMLLIYSYDVSYNQLMNTDFIVIEVVRGIAGSMGIIMTVPSVAFLTAMILNKQKKCTK